MSNRIKRYAFKHVCVLAVCAIITVSCATAPSSGSQTGASQQQQVGRDARQRIYMAHLRAEGYTPTIDDDGYISFKREGYTYYIYIDSTDPSFLFIQLPTIKTINSDADMIRAADAISYANRRTKVAKAYIAGSPDQWVSIGAEAFLENPDHFAVLFGRLMTGISAAKENFESNM
jgi:hypothetical protein